jgi:hypothetical protein
MIILKWKMELVGSEKAIQNAKTILEFFEIKFKYRPYVIHSK